MEHQTNLENKELQQTQILQDASSNLETLAARMERSKSRYGTDGFKSNPSGRKKKKGFPWQIILGFVILFGIAGAGGFYMGSRMDSFIEPLGASFLEDSPFGSMLVTALMLMVVYLCYMIQIVIHEGGHLVCGLLSGYKFSSFRIGSLLLCKENGKWKLKTYKLAGTGGQCLMAPPAYNNGAYPTILYNLGGCLANGVTSLICFLLLAVTTNPWLRLIEMATGVCGIIALLTNGIPIKTTQIANDGWNVLHLAKDPAAMRSLWAQLSVADLQGKGKRLKEMDPEIFNLPKGANLEDPIISAMAVFNENRAMDEQDFEQSQEIIDFLQSDEVELVGVYKPLLVCDQIYIDLISGNKEAAKKRVDKNLKRFMTSMASFPAVIRTQYVMALLMDEDEKKAEKIKAQFLQRMKSYPYAGEAQSELDLIEKAQDMWRQDRKEKDIETYTVWQESV